jgi:hypothetical protein
VSLLTPFATIHHVNCCRQKTAKPQHHGIGRDSHGTKFKNFEVAKVWRVENHLLWSDYVHRRDLIGAGSPAFKHSGKISPEIATKSFRPPSGAVLDAKSNEQFLFHGTKSEHVDALCNRGMVLGFGQKTLSRVLMHRMITGLNPTHVYPSARLSSIHLLISVTTYTNAEGFDDRIGNLGGLFGSGCYFAENSSKSDEYVPPADKQYMLLCRVVLGRPFPTPHMHLHERRPPCINGPCVASGGKFVPCSHPLHDSLLATTKAIDPKSFLERFREFVVYDRAMCYPAYLIEYKRK